VDVLRVALIVPNVRAPSGGMERMLRLLEHGGTAGIDYCAYVGPGASPSGEVERRLAALSQSGRIEVRPLPAASTNGSAAYDAVAVPTEYWWGAWKRARSAGLRGPPRIDMQLLPYLGSLDLLKVANVAEPSLHDLIRLPFLQAERYAQGPVGSAVQAAACVGMVRGLARLRGVGILAISRVIERNLSSIGYRGPVVVPECPNGIERAPVEAAWRDDAPIEYDAAYAARAHPQKGFLDLPEIVARLRVHLGDGLRIAVCGTPDEPRHEARFADLVRRHGIGANLVRLGRLSREGLYRTLRRSRMLLYPSYVDSFSLSVLESLSLGVPVAAYDTDAIGTIWAHRPGVFRAPVGRTRELADLAARVRRDGRLDEAREAAARQASSLLDAYTWDKAVRDERKFYEAAG
jgi:glycosyltransferase involved in cell wall biosynthesis